MRATGVKPSGEAADNTAAGTAESTRQPESATGSGGAPVSPVQSTGATAPDVADGPANAFERGWLDTLDVVDVQRGLGIGETGLLDAATRRAIRERQTRAGQPADGLLTQDLVASLVSGLR